MSALVNWEEIYEIARKEQMKSLWNSLEKEIHELTGAPVELIRTAEDSNVAWRVAVEWMKKQWEISD